MDGERPNIVALAGGGDDLRNTTVGGKPIPQPPPGSHLSTTGRRLYRWICEALMSEGRNVGAAGIQIVMLAQALDAWAQDMKDCNELGRYGISEKGARYELPHSYNERNAREQIKRELPEACLTVMSTIEARLKESKTAGGQQDDLFDELVGHGRNRPSAA